MSSLSIQTFNSRKMKLHFYLSLLFFTVLVLSVTGTTQGQDPAIAANYNISEANSSQCADELEAEGGDQGNWPAGLKTRCELLGGKCVIPVPGNCKTKFYKGSDFQCRARFGNNHLCCMHEFVADAPCTEHGNLQIGFEFTCLDVKLCDGLVLRPTHLCGGDRCRKCCVRRRQPLLVSTSQQAATSQPTTPQTTTRTPQLMTTTAQPYITTDDHHTNTTDNHQTTTATTHPTGYLTTTSGTNETCDELYQAKPFELTPSPFPPQLLCHALGGHCADMIKGTCKTKYFEGSLQCKEAFGNNFGCCMNMKTADGQCTALGPKFECMDAKKCEPNKGEVIPARGLCGGPPCRMCCRLN